MTHARGRAVTDEPFRVAPELLGRPLAGIGRRGLALGFDTALLLIVAIPTIVALALGAIWLQAPGVLAEGPRGMLGGVPTSGSSWERYQADLLRLVHTRRPDLLPGPLARVIASGGTDAEISAAAEGLIGLQDFNLGNGEPSRYDPESRALRIRGDVLFGPFDGIFSIFSIYIVGFTLLGMRGRSPGKWLLGIRVVRLDGRPMQLRQSFERAGGYSASLATLGTGFLRAIRDPNRQALHDRICATVVVREPGPGRVRRAFSALGRRLTRR